MRAIVFAELLALFVFALYLGLGLAQPTGEEGPPDRVPAMSRSPP
jgi:hypothetical protein